MSKEWKRLLDPYTPRDNRTMQDTAKYEPFRIHYIEPYSVYAYEGIDRRTGKPYKYQKINPYSTSEWDVAAEKAGQKDKLYRILNDKLQSGQY